VLSEDVNDGGDCEAEHSGADLEAMEWGFWGSAGKGEGIKHGRSTEENRNRPLASDLDLFPTLFRGATELGNLETYIGKIDTDSHCP
jgi:hypothetical protein